MDPTFVDKHVLNTSFLFYVTRRNSFFQTQRNKRNNVPFARVSQVRKELKSSRKLSIIVIHISNLWSPSMNSTLSSSYDSYTTSLILHCERIIQSLPSGQDNC